jgi:hypothetical protein
MRRSVIATIVLAVAFAAAIARAGALDSTTAHASDADAMRDIDRLCDRELVDAAPAAATFVSIFDGHPGDGVWRLADDASLSRIAHDPNIYSEVARVRYLDGRVAVVEIVSSSLDFGARSEYCYRPAGTLARASETSAGTMNADRELRYLDDAGNDVGSISHVELVTPRPGASPSADVKPATLVLFRTIRALPFYYLIGE